MHLHCVYFVFMFCFIQIFCNEIPENLFDATASYCVEELKIDRQHLINMMDEKFYLRRGDPTLTKFIECTIKKRNLINENGEIDVGQIQEDVLNILIPMMKMGHLKKKNSIGKRIVNNCIHVTGDNNADKIINLHNCLIDTLHNIII